MVAKVVAVTHLVQALTGLVDAYSRLLEVIMHICLLS